MKIMGLLQEKLSKYREPQKYMEAGIYPYFREIDSHQDTEVTMSGKKVLMFGSNSYMGLTYDKRIVEAAIECNQKVWYWMRRFSFLERNTRYSYPIGAGTR